MATSGQLCSIDAIKDDGMTNSVVTPCQYTFIDAKDAVGDTKTAVEPHQCKVVCSRFTERSCTVVAMEVEIQADLGIETLRRFHRDVAALAAENVVAAAKKAAATNAAAVVDNSAEAKETTATNALKNAVKSAAVKNVAKRK